MTCGGTTLYFNSINKRGSILWILDINKYDAQQLVEVSPKRNNELVQNDGNPNLLEGNEKDI